MHPVNGFVKSVLIILFSVFLVNCMNNQMMEEKDTDRKISQYSELDTATVAGGCFWCVEAPYEKIDGVVEAISGFSGGKKENPTYDEVSSGKTKYAESVQIIFDPYVITYWELLDVYWKNIDPTDADGSFYDRGSQYRPVIFYHNEDQRKLAEKSKKWLENVQVFDKPIVTKIEKFTGFYPAEDYHQNFYKTHPQRYHEYRQGSGRDKFIEKHWGNLEKRLTKFEKPDREMLKEMLTPLQYRVTQLDATEPAFKNLYWDNKKEGIYVDIVSREPLFSSTDKFKSGTGWPSFTKPLDSKYIVEKTDMSMGMERTEIRSKLADSHLGHVFNDGPPPTGLRYCMDSASLWFIAKKDMEKYGYGKYLSLFE